MFEGSKKDITLPLYELWNVKKNGEKYLKISLKNLKSGLGKKLKYVIEKDSIENKCFNNYNDNYSKKIVKIYQNMSQSGK